MVKAELFHNPYLLHTWVEFNGQKPRINSQIEKYYGVPLKKWVHLIPTIFYNEMNGYDFEFLFSGTKPDFEEIKKAFVCAGVSEKEVKLFHKKEIENPNTKSKEIDTLLSWLKENDNRRFDYKSFMEEQSALFEELYPVYLLNGMASDDIDPLMSPEQIDSVEDIPSDDVSGIPIVFYVNKQNRISVRDSLIKILDNDRIQHEQLFFMVAPELDKKQVIRVISDLGIHAPQIIDSYDDNLFVAYMRNFPVTEYVSEAISVFKNEIEKIQDVLQIANSNSIVTNEDACEEIKKIEEEIHLLRSVDDSIVQRDNYSMPLCFSENLKVLGEQLSTWKIKKIKAVGIAAGEFEADDYDKYIAKAVRRFCQSMKIGYESAGAAIRYGLELKYSAANKKYEYKPTDIQLDGFWEPVLQSLKSVLLDLKEISRDETATGYLGRIKKVSEEDMKSATIITYPLELWRRQVCNYIIPLAEYVISQNYASLVKYYDALSDDYHNRLSGLISVKNEEKEGLSEQLSGDEKKLQEDNDWLNEFQNQLQMIERD